MGSEFKGVFFILFCYFIRNSVECERSVLKRIRTHTYDSFRFCNFFVCVVVIYICQFVTLSVVVFSFFFFLQQQIIFLVNFSLLFSFIIFSIEFCVRFILFFITSYIRDQIHICNMYCCIQSFANKVNDQTLLFYIFLQKN